MKKYIISPINILLAVAAGALVLVGCAGSNPPANTVSLLGASGFRVRTPDTPQKKEIFAKLPAYKVEKVVVKGQTYYVYKDESKGLALVGHEAEYQRYREMARQDRLMEGHYNAEMASAAEIDNWYGASGSDWW